MRTSRIIKPLSLAVGCVTVASAIASCSAHNAGSAASSSPDASSSTSTDSGLPFTALDAMASTMGTLVMFGGEDGHSNCLADTWTWNGATWTEINVTGPSARARSVMAALHGQLVVFGGWFYDYHQDGSVQQIFGDTWTFDGATWTQVNVPGPPARDDAVMALLNDKLVLFGGLDENGSPLSDTWTWDGATWTNTNATGPTGREFATMAPLGDTLVLTGGENSGTLLSDTWTWDGAAWTQISASGPAARDSAAMATLGGEIVLFGGYNSTTTKGAAALLADTWTWNGTAWAQTNPSEPIPRASAAMAPYDGQLVLFGGYGPQYSLSDTWTWNGVTWTQITVANPPSGRTRPVMALLPSSSQ